MTGKLLVLIIPLLLITIVPQARGINTTSSSGQIKEQLKTKNAAEDTRLKNTVKNTVGDVKDAIKTAREEFKEKLKTITDAKKKMLVERIDTKITEFNEDKMEKYTIVLERLQMFVDKANSNASNAALLSDVKAAQNAINAAKAAVEAQSAKTYTITITNETSLRQNVGTVVTQFRKDVFVVFDLVQNARLSVVKLYANKVMTREEATRSAR